MSEPLVLTASTAVSAMGRDVSAHRDALLSRSSGLRPNDFDPAADGWIGRVPGVEAHALPPAMAGFDCCNNRLAGLALRSDGFADAVAEAHAEYAAGRIAVVVLGTSTSGVNAAEDAYCRRDGEGMLPTAFHSSVHNAAAGYWSIAMASRQPATCLGCHDWTWAASLLKVMADVAADGEPVLLCCYDHPLAALRPTMAAFGVGLVSHASAMVLLDRVEAWDADSILYRACSHLDEANPLRRDGRLAACCGLEYALQAAALHGALAAGGVAQRSGYVAVLRAVALHVDRLDKAEFGELRVTARLERQEATGIIYALKIQADDGAPLLSGHAKIALTAGSTAAALLAERGRNVVLLEKAERPRFHIGESLLPRNTALLERLGLRNQIAALGVLKPNAEFVSDATGQSVHRAFALGLDKQYNHSWQIRRAEFDELLFRTAQHRGISVQENTRVTGLRSDVTSTGNYSYRSSAAWGEGYMLTGDAYGFVDPVFSSGVLQAMAAGDLSADTWLDKPAAGRVQARQVERDGPVSLLAGNLRGSWNSVIPVLAFKGVFYAMSLAMRLGLHPSPRMAPAQLAAAE